MVACPRWRAYVADFAAPAAPRNSTDRLYPVAIDPVAYQIPVIMRKLNYIRHNLRQSPPPETEGLLSQLTEVLCRDLRSELHEMRKPNDLKQRNASDSQSLKQASRPLRTGKLKIFLSHAKADGTKTPVALKEYILGKTQCEPFFDETDIPFGYDYTNVLREAISEDSAGLIVVQGDHYANRPWCRKEIRDFLKPVPDAASVGAKKKRVAGAPVYFIPPVVVVDTMEGKKIGRTIPELGHAPCLRWQPDVERLVVSSLLREILLGLFYRFMARDIAKASNPKSAADPKSTIPVVINRPPDPVMVDRILGAANKKNKTIVYPGYGLSQMEKDGLTMTFPNVRFQSFSEWSSPFPDPVSAAASTDDLAGHVIMVSVGTSPDILEAGLMNEHNKELLNRLLRPIFRRQVSLLYGGAMPDTRELNPWEGPTNFTSVFLDMLLSERSAAIESVPVSRLYNLSAWPYCSVVTESLVAQWTDICSFITFTQEKAGIEPSLWQNKLNWQAPTPQQLVNQARCLTAMRKQACAEITCTLPDKPRLGKQEFSFSTFAHIFLGGRTTYSSGIIPGVLEEILYALAAKKPVFIIRAGRGAAGLFARWLAEPPPKSQRKERPAELTVDYYLKDPYFSILQKEIKKLPEGTTETPNTAFDRLWQYVQSAGKTGLSNLLNNGLDDSANKKLLKSESYAEICELVWEGINIVKDGKH
jgi:hypothetical protein